MRQFVAIFALVLALAVLPATAQQFATPEDLVETLYGSYFNKTGVDDFSPYLSDEMTRAMAGRKVGLSQFEVLGFDPIVGSPDWEPRDFKVTRLSLVGNTAKLNVRFTSHGTAVSVTIDLVREPVNGWQIAHLAGQSGTHTWCTNALVEASKPAS